MPNTTKSLEDLAKDDSFFNDLKNGNFCLVLGAGFSFGKDKANRLKNKVIRVNPLYHHIPLTNDFIEITKLECKKKAGDFQNAVTFWEKSIKADVFKRDLLRNLFLLDVEDFNKHFYSTYKEILTPDWHRVFTFNFDNVFETICRNNEYEPLSYPDDKEFSSNKSKQIAHVHGRITENSDLTNIVFFGNKYALLHKSTNDLYYSLLNSVNSINQPKNLIVVGCQFNEVIQIQKFYSEINNTAKPKIYQFDIVEPTFSGDRENYDYIFIKASTFQFLEFLKKYKSKIEKIRKIPENLILLKKEQNKNEIPSIKFFSDFLESKHLKYFSRNEFKSKLKHSGKLSEEETNSFYSERDLLKFIYSNDYYGLVIYGQGGIGKTRLMLELGKRLFKKKYIVIEVKNNFANINELINYITPEYDNNYILLFDYIEEQKIFEQIVSWIINNKKEKIKIIANCRNTVRTDIEYWSGPHLKFIDIDNPKQIEDKYKKAVIYSIISGISDSDLLNQAKNKEILKAFYAAKPSFAAFIKYIHTKSGSSDLNISENETFKLWLIKRLKFTIAKTLTYAYLFEKKQYIFKILSCLPADSFTVRKLKTIIQDDISFSNEINKLIKDGWVDENADRSLKVVHDTVNDTLLIQFLEYFRFDSHHIMEFLDFALKNDSVSSMMWSIQRIWDEIPKDNQHSFQREIADFLDNSINEKTAKQDWFKYKMDNSHLLEEGDRIRLLIKHKSFLKETFELEKFGSSLSFSMYWLSKYNSLNENEKANYSDWLKHLFFDEWDPDNKHKYFVNNARLGGNIISCYIKLYGIDDYISLKFQEYISIVECIPSNLEYISYVLTAWLDNNGEINQQVNELVVSWFSTLEKENPGNITARFLINSWLKRGEDISIILKYIKCDKYNLKVLSRLLSSCIDNSIIISLELKNVVIAWFRLYEDEKPEDFNPTHLIKNWLQKGDDIHIASRTLLICLNNSKIALQDKAELIGFWLYKSDDYKLVEPFIVNCLEGEIWYRTAYYIIMYWLEKSDNPLMIKPFLSKWLNNDLDPEAASHIFNIWLKKGDDPDILIHPIQTWIKNIDITDKSIGFSLTNFIFHKGNFNELKTEILEWISENSDTNQSIYLLSYFLTNLNAKLIDDSLLIRLEILSEKVLTNFFSSKSVENILFFWCVKAGKLSVIEPFIHKWLSTNWSCENAGTIMSYWIKNEGDINKIKEFVLPWLNIFAKIDQAGILMNLWSQKVGNIIEVKEHIVPWLRIYGLNKHSTYLMANWLEHGNDLYLIKDFIKPFFEIKENQEFDKSSFLISSWLEKTNLPLLVKDAIKPWLAINGNDSESSVSICSFWLEKGDEMKLVEDYIKGSLVKYCQNRICFHVINSWLNKEGDFEIIRPAIIEYLKYNWEFGYAVRIIKSCIRLNKIFHEIEVAIFKINKKYGNNPFSNYIEILDNKIIYKNELENQSGIKNIEDESKNAARNITANLNRGKSLNLIKTDIIEFQNKYGLDSNASYFLPTWIKSGNDFDFIKDYIIDWLNINLLEPNKPAFVLAAALHNEKGFDVVHDKAIEWLKKFGETDEAKFILSMWLHFKGNENVKEIEYWIFYWVDNFYDQTKGIWREDLLKNYTSSIRNKEK